MEQSTQLVEHFFRHESANLIAVLTRAFGIRRIELVEDMVQSAMLEAMRSWRHHGLPDNPQGWIHRVAKNKILDSLRREKTHEKAIALAGHSIQKQDSVVDQWLDQQHIADSLLRMIFFCCHPSLERKTQIALTLKTLCGFGISEIAHGLLLNHETVKKRISRAKKSLAGTIVAIEVPKPHEIAERLNVVHDVLYLMFNEGYWTSHGDRPIRDDICEEAVRLCHLLSLSPYATPTTKALLALQLLHAARLNSRVDSDGLVVLLEDQDRSQWDRQLIQTGGYWLAQSETEVPTKYHFEAAIAMQHCLAGSVAETRWDLIIKFYDRLKHINPSPIYKLNQAIAIAQTGDTNTALRQLKSLRQEPQMTDYLLLDCAIANVFELDQDWNQASDAYLKALSKANTPHERSVLKQKLQHINEKTFKRQRPKHGRNPSP